MLVLQGSCACRTAFTCRSPVAGTVVPMLLLGHRGAARVDVPENTLAAVDRALAQGADGVEVDVRLTRDLVPVLSHDPGLRRTTGVDRGLGTLDHADLPRVGNHALPTMDEVVELVSGRGLLVLELKTPAWRTPCPVEAVVEHLRRHLLDDVVVSSFDRPRLARLRGRLAVRTGLLSRPGVPATVAVRRALADGHDEAHVHVRSLLARPETVAQAARLGLGVVAWTVNRPADLLRCSDFGVAAVISDDAAAARRALSKRRQTA